MGILTETLTKADVFWSFLGVLLTFIGLLFIVPQLSKIAREVSTHKVEGLNLAREHLQSKNFTLRVEAIDAARSKGDKNYPIFVKDDVVLVFKELDFIAKLIEVGYLDKRLLFYEFADQLYSIERIIHNFEHREGSKIGSVKAKYPNAYRLMKEAAKNATMEPLDALWRRNSDRLKILISGLVGALVGALATYLLC